MKPTRHLLVLSITFRKDITSPVPFNYFINNVSIGLQIFRLNGILTTLSYIAEFCVSINVVSLEMNIQAKKTLQILTILNEFREV